MTEFERHLFEGDCGGCSGGDCGGESGGAAQTSSAFSDFVPEKMRDLVDQNPYGKLKEDTEPRKNLNEEDYGVDAAFDYMKQELKEHDQILYLLRIPVGGEGETVWHLGMSDPSELGCYDLEEFLTKFYDDDFNYKCTSLVSDGKTFDLYYTDYTKNGISLKEVRERFRELIGNIYAFNYMSYGSWNESTYHRDTEKADDLRNELMDFHDKGSLNGEEGQKALKAIKEYCELGFAKQLDASFIL